MLTQLAREQTGSRGVPLRVRLTVGASRDHLETMDIEGRYIERDGLVPGCPCGRGYLPSTVKKCPVPECAVALAVPRDRVPTM
jgi:hypothetical protein